MKTRIQSIVLSVMLLFFVIVFSYSQTVVAKSKQQTMESLTKTATKVSMVYASNPSLTVWKSKNNKLFVVKCPASGKCYKVYVEEKK